MNVTTFPCLPAMLLKRQRLLSVPPSLQFELESDEMKNLVSGEASSSPSPAVFHLFFFSFFIRLWDHSDFFRYRVSFFAGCSQPPGNAGYK